jgi:hypothetical protein
VVVSVGMPHFSLNRRHNVALLRELDASTSSCLEELHKPSPPPVARIATARNKGPAGAGSQGWEPVLQCRAPVPWAWFSGSCVLRAVV